MAAPSTWSTSWTGKYCTNLEERSSRHRPTHTAPPPLYAPRDDPEAVDLHALYSEEEMSPDEEEELLVGQGVDLDDEYDLIHDHVAGVVEPGPPEAKGPTAGAAPGFEAIKDAGEAHIPCI